MLRMCPACFGSLGAEDLAVAETMGLEADRHAAGIEGIFFRYYVCRQCDEAVIFIDVVPRLGEAEEAFLRRRKEVEHMTADLNGRDVTVVVGRPDGVRRGRRASALQGTSRN